MTKDDPQITSVINSDMTFAEMDLFITNYMAERDWLNNPARGLATSIVLEAAELLEHYQWHDKPVGDNEALGDELADVLIYAFQFAHIQGIDMVEAIQRKLAKSAKKYPAEAFKNKDAAERRKAWMDAKLNYRKEGL